MAFMDPFAFDLPSRPRVPSFFSRFSGRSAHAQHGGPSETDLHAYLRAIGAVYRPADFAPRAYSASVNPPTCELYAAALGAHVVQPAAEVPVPLQRAVPFFHDDSSSKNSKNRPRLCPDYDDDIDANLKMMEKNAGERPLPDYLTTVQGDNISPLTRGALVLWMDKFVRHYELAPGTLHLAVACIDRVLSVRTARNYRAYEFQLLGATAVFTAAKYEDQSTKHKLNTAEIARYCGLETSEEVRETERDMMKALGFQISGPTAYTFVGHFTRYFGQGKEELRVQRLAHRIADQSLLSHLCVVGFLPSVVAASAIFLARFALNPSDVLAWNAELQELTGYGSLDLSSCVQIMYSFSQSLICNPPF
ncbi:putative cyclin-F2-1 [Brachypodium distachyon]|nr:putative cyclin-F2-1 [Brachypodium distachyon]|eukprot:XP_003572702.1 putative cyclin-F2-1 [Brachypodium distachyon]